MFRTRTVILALWLIGSCPLLCHGGVDACDAEHLGDHCSSALDCGADGRLGGSESHHSCDGCDCFCEGVYVSVPRALTLATDAVALPAWHSAVSDLATSHRFDLWLRERTAPTDRVVAVSLPLLN